MEKERAREKRARGTKGVSEVRHAAPQSSNTEILTGGALWEWEFEREHFTLFVSSYLLVSSLIDKI